MVRYPLLGLCLVAWGCSSDSTSNGSPDSGTTGGGTAEQTCVDTINQYRATLGLPAYQRWSAEESCADGEAKNDEANPGTPHWSFKQPGGPPCGESAQNECPGWPGPPSTMIPQCLQMMWNEGPGADFSTHGHYINMSSKSYTMVSCGFYTLPDGSVWAVQDFK
jgi:hypothetical protein